MICGCEHTPHVHASFDHISLYFNFAAPLQAQGGQQDHQVRAGMSDTKLMTDIVLP
jgi:hypothetical protein